MTRHRVQYRKDCGYQHNIPLQKAIREFGWANVKIEILVDGLTKAEACEQEINFIKELDANNPQVGYNISKGGTSTYAGLKHTEEYKKHMSELYKGRTYSEETIQKMKDAHAKERKPVTKYSIEGDRLEKYESLKDAALSVNGYSTNICRAVKSGKPYKGFIWIMEGGDER